MSVECVPRASHKREADNGVDRISVTSQSSASHHNSAVLAELTARIGIELETAFTRSTRSLQLPSERARSVTMPVLSDVEWSKSVAALILFAHSTLRPRRPNSSSTTLSGFLPLTNIMVLTASLLFMGIASFDFKLARYAPELT